MTGRVSKSILNTIPQASARESLWPALRDAVKIDPKTLIVIDDDPTGSQTVYDINVLLDYSMESIKMQLDDGERLFFILTNTRGMPEPEATAVTSRVMENIHRAQHESSAGRRHPIQIISRSDSTLRGHYPAEVQAIIHASPYPYDATVIVPAFFEGGRVTFNDIHYLSENDHLIPVGETPFARDPHFGFHSSNLVDWVMEKSKGTTSRDMIVSISLEDIRRGVPAEIADKLEALQHGSVVVVNAVHQHDLNAFVLGLMEAESRGQSFLYRTAASFVSSRAGLEPRPLLGSHQVSLTGGGNSHQSGHRRGGLVVVGSYVPKSTAQLNSVLASNVDVETIEIDLFSSLHKWQASTELLLKSQEMAATIDRLLAANRDVVLYTPRTFVQGAALQDTAVISKFITDIVANLSKAPSFLIAKGGITSHDVAANGLGAKVCRVVGQIEPGVPLWRLGHESKFPGMPYVVFPGNVGDDEALLRVVRKLGVPDRPSATATSSSRQLHPKPVPPSTPQSSAAPVTTFPLRAESARLLDVLHSARSNQRAIPAFNVYNLEGASAVVKAAETMRAPVMLQVHPASLHFGGAALLHMLYSLKQRALVPVYLHLDHATEANDIMLALNNGVDSVMIDGSHLSLEDNMKWTASLAKVAHGYGCVVEAELGRLVGQEDGLSVAEKEGKMTDPAVVTRYISETKVDLLAVTIGNVHGKYKAPPALDFARLGAISEAAMAVKDADRFPGATGAGPVKLVLHGASGLSLPLVQRALQLGVCKFNVNTDLREAALEEYQKAFRGTGAAGQDILPLMKQTQAAMESVALAKFSLFGWKQQPVKKH